MIHTELPVACLEHYFGFFLGEHRPFLCVQCHVEFRNETVRTHCQTPSFQ